MWSAILVLNLMACGGAPEVSWDTFGEGLVQSDPVAAKTLLDDPTSYVGTSMAVEGEVADVCQKQGCWMVVRDGERSIRVTMKDHAFAVPKDCDGATARVHGEVVAKGIDPKTVEHYKSESAKPGAMPEAAMSEGDVTYELVATAVQIRR